MSLERSLESQVFPHHDAIWLVCHWFPVHFRWVYKWFLLVYNFCYGLGIGGYFCILFTFLGFNILIGKSLSLSLSMSLSPPPCLSPSLPLPPFLFVPPLSLSLSLPLCPSLGLWTYCWSCLILSLQLLMSLFVSQWDKWEYWQQ